MRRLTEPRPRSRDRLTSWIVLVAGVLLAIGATTFSDPTALHVEDRPLCLRCGDLAGTDLALNLLLFLPFGVGVAMLGGRARSAIALAALLSLGIESLQLDLIPGRDASIRDLLANAAGSGCGALIAVGAPALLRPAMQPARALSVAAALVILAVLGLSAWATRPDVPHRIYWVQWTPVRFGYDAFRGTLLRLELAGSPVSGGESLDPVRRPEIYRDGIPPANALVIAGPPTGGIGFIGRLVTAQAEVVMFGRRGNDLVYRFSIAGRHLGLRPPAYVLSGAFATLATDSVAIHGSVRGGRVRLRACTEASGCVTRAIPLSVSRAWSLVSPIEVASEPLVLTLSVLFLALLFLPLGYWSAWSASPLAPVVAVAGLALLPIALALPIATPLDWVAAALGLGAGAGLGRLTMRRR
jgi:hypothetical protein